MPDQYRRDNEREGGRGPEWRGPERERDDDERGEHRGRHAGDWRGERVGQYGRGEHSTRNPIARESGWDRGGWGRDERDSRDWQQRVDESRQGYRTRDPMFDAGWEREPDWRAQPQREWRSRPDWPVSAGSPAWRDEDERARWRSTNDRGWQAPDSGRRYGTGPAVPSDRPADTWQQDRGHRQSAHERGREGGEGAAGTHESASPNYSGRGPKGYKRSDDRICEEICDRLMDDHDVDASEIEVQVRGGEVTLTGSVGDRDQKRRAEELAERCSGVSEVANNLRVNRQTMGLGSQQGASQAGQAGPSAQPRGSTTTGS